ncbi:hypothetical protein Q7P37_000906 [Cladosporium fusiforme]
MATTMPMTRMPFGELSSSRVQQLSSAKNRQNGFLAKSSPLSGKPLTPSMSPAKVTGKRTASAYDDADSENADPLLFSPSKKSKSDACDKSFTFSVLPAKSMPPPPARTPARANISSPRAPLTAPAGRSPPRRNSGITKNRRGSAPFTRVDPPFMSRVSSSLPFSLDAAISGSMSAAITPTKAKSAGATIQESMPASWEFEIYEDTPEEEAANLMEHSTQILDLSSDDESTKAKRDCRGKENEPPEGYDQSTASQSFVAATQSKSPTPQRVKNTEIIRRKTTEMDDGERSPLCDLETDDFVPEGLAKDAHVIVTSSPEKTRLDIKSLFAVAPPAFTFPSLKEGKNASKLAISSTTTNEDDVKDDIVVWEDEAEAKDGAETEGVAEGEAEVKCEEDASLE